MTEFKNLLKILNLSAQRTILCVLPGFIIFIVIVLISLTINKVTTAALLSKVTPILLTISCIIYIVFLSIYFYSLIHTGTIQDN